MPFDREFKNPALILGGDVAGLWAARILGRRGVNVYIVTNSQYDVALSSKYCKKKRVITSPLNCEVLKKILREATRVTSKRLVVYPVTDLSALNLSRIKNDVSDDFCFVVGERDAVETLVNKRKFYQVLRRNKIPHPATYFPKDLADADRLSSQISYPVFIKPSITQLFHLAFGYKRKGFVANSRTELLKYYRLSASSKVDVLFQDVISAAANSFCQLEGYYNREYLPSVLFARQAMRIWPLDFGNSTLCRSVALFDFAEESREISRFLRSIKYNGLMSADFKRDPKDGRLKLLEINARLWLHFWLPTKCGVDIIFASYLDALGEKAEGSHGYITGVKSLYFPDDLKSSAKMILRGELGVSEYTSSLLGKKVFAYFDRRDIFPFFRFYTNWALQTLKRVKRAEPYQMPEKLKQ